MSRRRRGRPRREPTRLELALRGLLATVVVVVLLGAAYLHQTGSLGGEPTVSADVPDAGGSLRKGSDVKIAGVIVGRVDGISRADDGGVAVAMSMHGDDLERVPDNVEARILPATVFGTTFVDLVVHDTPSDVPLKPGAVIPADTTQGTLELQQALDDIDDLVKALGPAELSSAITSAATALQGRGQQLGRIVDTADRYLGRLNPEIPLARRDVRALTTNLRIVDRVAPDLLDATRDGLVTAHTIITQRAAITALIAGGTTLADLADDFVASNEQQLIRMVDDGAVLLDVLYDNRQAGITGSLQANIEAGRTIPTLLDRGFFRSEAVLTTSAPRYYTAADRPRYGDAAPSARLSGATLRGLVGGAR